MNIALWIVQGLLALAFLLAGVMKATLPAERLNKNFPWSKDVSLTFTRFIGVAELLGALGLILPAITGIQPQWLTVAAASGLVIVMLSASIFHITRREPPITIVLLLLAAFIVVGRLAWAPFA